MFCPRTDLSLQTQDTKAAVLPKGRSSTANSGTSLQFYWGWIGAVASRRFSHPTLFSIWTDLKKSEKIPGASTWRWGEWIWLTGSSGHHRNSPQGLNIIRRRGVVGRVPAFQPGGTGSIPGGVRNFNFCPGIECVLCLCSVLCILSGGGPDIVLTAHSRRPALVYLSSVLVHRKLLPLQTSDPWAFGL